MFKYSQRLRRQKDIDNVFKNGKGAYGANLGVKAIVNNMSINRYTVIVGKKTNKSAVKRNLFKRRARAALREAAGIRKGYDILLILGKNIENLNYHDLKKELFFLLKKIRLYNE